MANYNFYFQYRLLLVLVFATVVLSVSAAAAADDSNKNLRQNNDSNSNNNSNNNRHRHRRDEGEIGEIGEADEPPPEYEPDQKSILPDLLLPEKQTRIINGYQVNELRYPYFALLKAAADQSNDGFRFRCGAVLIGPRLVVSAAHCDFFDKDKMSFQIGAYKNSNDGRTVKINSKIVHPQYNENEFTNDIVIYQLEANVSSVVLHVGPIYF
jgi:V8-like Glu-specific endopeptidase